MSQLETCQNCERAVAVDERGRTEAHQIGPPDPERFWNNPHCGRSGHPSIEELARRKAARAARQLAQTAELAPEAHAALDAYLLRDSEAAARFNEETLASIAPARLAEFRRAALFEYNRRNQTRHRWAVFCAPPQQPPWEHRWTCRFCSSALEHPRIIGGPLCGADYAAKHFADHLTQCALEYLAGLRGEPQP